MLEGRPGPEATVFCLAFQLGARLSEIGQQYDVIEQFVRLGGTLGGSRSRPAAPLSILPLAHAPVRRDHLSNHGHTRKEAPHESRSRRQRTQPVPRGLGGGICAARSRRQGGRHGKPSFCKLYQFQPSHFRPAELNRLFGLYGRKVAAGEWRDYAIDFLKDRAVFSVFRRACEVPLYRIEKNPKLARRQGTYSVISSTGLIVRRGQELDRVLRAIDKSLSVVAG